ncbi:MAG: PAS domain S-box protein, partial [Deltaproteobacteria bacterium]|nr:PAS domain S-box protein [Deltaproteobacteria bacterium]
MIQKVSIIPSLSAAAILIMAAAYIFWRRRHWTASRTGVFILLSCAELMIVHALEVSSTEFQTKIFWNKMQYLCLATAPTLWLIYTLQYTGRSGWLTLRNVLFLVIVPLAALLLAFTNESHGIMWTAIRWNAKNPYLPLEKTYGPGVMVFIVYSICLMCLASFFFIQLLIRSQRLYRWQACALLATTLVPFLGFSLDLFKLSPLPGYSLTSLSLILGGATVGLLIYRFRLGDILPVARSFLIEGMKDGVLVLDAQNRIVDMNPTIRQIIGCSIQEAFGNPIERVWKGWGTSKGVKKNESFGVRELVSSKGDDRRTYEMRISALRDWRDRLLAQLVILHDITERKRAEEALKRAYNELEDRVVERTAELSEASVRLKKEVAERRQAEDSLKRAYEELQNTQAQLIQSAKLASIGELAAGVAHELNQPLMVIRSTAQLMERAATNDALDRDKLTDLLKSVERNTKRMMRTIGHLRVFSRQSRKAFTPVDVNAVIEDCFLMADEQLRIHDIEVTKSLGSMLPKILGDANQLEQVFLNLITNARDAVEQREQEERRT